MLRAAAQEVGAGAWHDVAPVPAAAFGAPGCKSHLPPYLRQNCATADVACRVLHARGVACPEAAIAQAIVGFDWPGRYQFLPPRRPGGPSYLIDGSHNPAGMAALVAALNQDVRLRGRSLHALFASLPHKDHAGMAALLRPHVARWQGCALRINRPPAPGTPRPSPPLEMDLPTPRAALAAWDTALGPEDVVLVTGSLYLAGEALAALCHLPVDPPVWG